MSYGERDRDKRGQSTRQRSRLVMHTRARGLACPVSRLRTSWGEGVCGKTVLGLGILLSLRAHVETRSETMTAPLTADDLRAVLPWAEAGGGEIAGEQREYGQSDWDCGTACCLHGAAHLLARGRPTDDEPDASDYADFPLRSLLYVPDGRVLPVIRAALTGDRDVIRAAERAARAAGLMVYITDDCHGHAFGKAWLFDRATSHGQTGGVVYLCGQIGGEVWLFDSARSRGHAGVTVLVTT